MPEIQQMQQMQQMGQMSPEQLVGLGGMNQQMPQVPNKQPATSHPQPALPRVYRPPCFLGRLRRFHLGVVEDGTSLIDVTGAFRQLTLT